MGDGFLSRSFKIRIAKQECLACLAFKWGWVGQEGTQGEFFSEVPRHQGQKKNLARRRETKTQYLFGTKANSGQKERQKHSSKLGPEEATLALPFKSGPTSSTPRHSATQYILMKSRCEIYYKHLDPTTTSIYKIKHMAKTRLEAGS